MVNKLKKYWRQSDRLRKYLTVVAVFLLVFSLVFVSIAGNSFAASIPPDELTAALGGDVTDDRVELFPELTGLERIALVPFVATDSTGKQYHMYCLEKEKDWYEDTVITKTGTLDAGYAYIVQNGYPAKSLTGDGNSDSFLTQVAVWLYQDRIAGVSDDTTGVLTANQKSVILNSKYASIIKSLVDGAINAKNNYQNVKPEFSISSSSFHLDSTGNYLITDEISVSANVNFSSYQVAVDMNGAEILNKSNQPVTGKISSNEKFKIRIPLSKLTTADLDIKVTVILDYTQYEAYQYSPPATETGMQKSFAAVINAVSKQATLDQTIPIPTGSLTIEKVRSDNNQALAGAKIEVRRAINNELVQTFMTGTNPKTITNLLPGKYTITETSAPEGFLIDEKTVSVTINTNALNPTVKLTNSPLSFRVRKVDKTTGQAVAGAVIKIVNSSGVEVYRFTSTTDYTTIPELTTGSYQAIEVSPPAGYYLNSTPVSFTVSESNTSQNIEIQNTKTSVKLGKVDATTGKYIAGAELKLSREDGNMEPITFVSEDKARIFEGLSIGKYILEEASVPEGYVTSNSKISFEISSDGKMKNISLKSEYANISIQNKKLVIDTNKVAGYQFQLFTVGGDLVDTYDIKETAFTSDTLENGSYILKQTKVPEGTLMNSNPYYFTISDDVSNNTVYFANDYTKVHFEKKEMVGGENLAGAELVLRDEEGNVVEQWTTTTSAKVIEKLKPGNYTLSELKAPDGYQLNTSLLTIQVKDTSDIQVFTMYNDLKVEVPNTSRNSVLYFFIGTILVFAGLSAFGYVYLKRKKA